MHTDYVAVLLSRVLILYYKSIDSDSGEVDCKAERIGSNGGSEGD